MSESRRRRILTAFNDKAFMSSKDARALRILAEYLEPKSRFEHFHVDDTIVFMGSARTKSREEAEAALREAEAMVAMSSGRAPRCRWRASTRTRARPRVPPDAVVEGPRPEGAALRRVHRGGPGIMEAANRGAAEARGMTSA